MILGIIFFAGCISTSEYTRLQEELKAEKEKSFTTINIDITPKRPLRFDLTKNLICN